MVRVLVNHASKVFSELPQDTPILKRINQKERYLDDLPASFNRQEYVRIAVSISIPDKTAEGYITHFCKRGLIHREKQDHYLNPNAKETQDLREAKGS